MSCVYRYTDLKDNIIKYVGIVWGENRKLSQRIEEHKKDKWFTNGDWEIEYLDYEIKSRTDAEYIEAHFISLYHTDNYYNVKKSGWGVSSFLPDFENSWKQYKSIKKKKCDLSVQLDECNKYCKSPRYKLNDNMYYLLSNDQSTVMIYIFVNKIFLERLEMDCSLFDMVNMNYTVHHVNGHVEVRDSSGNFILSADTVSEAYHELEEQERESA